MWLWMCEVLRLHYDRARGGLVKSGSKWERSQALRAAFFSDRKWRNQMMDRRRSPLTPKWELTNFELPSLTRWGRDDQN
jgi:hypothetical protein